MSEAEDALNKGLLAGYAGKTPPGMITRGGVDFRVSHPPKAIMGDAIYHDEWISGRNGGGQETVITSEGAFTRVYVGGTIPEEDLIIQGINKGIVEGMLGKFLKASGGQTRLGDDYLALDEENKDWQYSYEVIERVPKIQLISGIEKIEYKGVLVFAHLIGISPITPRS